MLRAWVAVVLLQVLQVPMPMLELAVTAETAVLCLVLTVMVERAETAETAGRPARVLPALAVMAVAVAVAGQVQQAPHQARLAVTARLEAPVEMAAQAAQRQRVLPAVVAMQGLAVPQALAAVVGTPLIPPRPAATAATVA